ncbi:universal stress protein [Kushneria phosphatilytica]|nr:universal stress protein [Kushneria phosphatilytica]OHV10053.1 hypothetical protein BH688_10490 [Kushneria phosphatilytica]
MYQSILVPLDGSECAQKALKIAAHLKRRTDASLFLLHVPVKPDIWNDHRDRVGATTLGYTPEEVVQYGRQMVERSASSAALEKDDYTLLATSGDPADVILEQAEKLHVDAIFMGRRGMSNVQGLLIGSICQRVSHAAPCPVIVVH